MKRISLILLLISAILFSNAQQVVPDIRKNKGKNKTKTEQQQTGKDNGDKSAPDDMHTVPALNPSGNGGAATSDAEYALLRQAIDNAFLVVKASYNVRDKESGSNVTGTEFFSTVYCVIPLLPYGFGVDNRFLKPWKSDPQYDASKYGDDLVSVDKLEYKKLKEIDPKLYFEHESNGLRVLNILEKHNDRNGLNLTFEVRDGIISHCVSMCANRPIPKQ